VAPSFERFAELGVATTCEGAGGAGLIAGAFLRLVSGARAAGPARTAICGPADNLAAHRILETVREGDVVVLVPSEPRAVAVIGELMTRQAQVRGAAAVLVDGPVRDADEIAAFGMGVWARSLSAAGPAKAVPGELDVPVTVGGVRIEPGDVVVLDGDGVVVVPSDCIDEVLAAAEARVTWEAELRRRIEAGETTAGILGLRSDSR
jgi:4-hydroxy-4-methyl-2-oxoglutarate aldolase